MSYVHFSFPMSSFVSYVCTYCFFVLRIVCYGLPTRLFIVGMVAFVVNVADLKAFLSTVRHGNRGLMCCLFVLFRSSFGKSSILKELFPLDDLRNYVYVTF